MLCPERVFRAKLGMLVRYSLGTVARNQGPPRPWFLHDSCFTVGKGLFNFASAKHHLPVRATSLGVSPHHLCVSATSFAPSATKKAPSSDQDVEARGTTWFYTRCVYTQKPVTREIRCKLPNGQPFFVCTAQKRLQAFVLGDLHQPSLLCQP